MNVTNTTSVTKTHSNDVVSNPNAQLKSEDFMKLFLTELQYQDPTKPMDNQQMLQQTSQMTQLQTNDELKKSLNGLVSQMNTSTQFNSVAMIGKVADIGKDSLLVTDEINSHQKQKFDLYFDDAYKSGTIKIKDRNGDIVKTIDVKSGDKGVKSFEWDGKDDNGNYVDDGSYTITADYTTTNNKNKTTKLGMYPVNSIKFDKGEAYVKLGNNYVKLSDIKEVL